MKNIQNSMIGLAVLGMLVAACSTQQNAVSPMPPPIFPPIRLKHCLWKKKRSCPTPQPGSCLN